jgi:hypothetical protein
MSVVGFTVVAVSRMLIHAHDAHQQAACGRPQLVGRLYELGCIVPPPCVVLVEPLLSYFFVITRLSLSQLECGVACVRPSLTKS